MAKPTEQKVFNKLRDMAEAKDGKGAKLFAVAKSTAYNVNPLIVKLDWDWNARPLNREHVDGFKASIKNGVYVPPIIVKMIDGESYTREGFHRTQAYHELINEGVPIDTIAVIEFTGNDADAVMLSITSSSGLELTPLQRGHRYKLLIGFGWSEQKIAEGAGNKSVQHVRDMLLLANANNDVQVMLKEGKVAGHVALKFVREHGNKAGKELKEQLASAQRSGRKKVTQKTVRNNETKPDAKTQAATQEKAALTVAEFLSGIMRNPKSDGNTLAAAITLHNGCIGRAGDEHAVEPVGITLHEAIQIERDTNGEVKAETLCAEHTGLIEYLRSTAK